MLFSFLGSLENAKLDHSSDPAMCNSACKHLDQVLESRSKKNIVLNIEIITYHTSTMVLAFL